jgi:hypothetical protein
MILRIVWKQWREQRLQAGLLLAFGIALVLVMRFAQPRSWDAPLAVFFLTFVAAACGMVCGVFSLADEQEGQDWAFLARLAPCWMVIWLARILAGAAITLGQALLLAVAASCAWTGAAPWCWVIPLYALIAFGWGAFVAVLTGPTQAFLIGGALTLGSVFGGQAVVRESFLGEPDAREAIAVVVVAAGTILASGLVYCWVDLQRSLQVSWPPAFLGSPRLAAEWRWLWLEGRRYRPVLVFLALGFVLGALRPLHGLLFWPLVTLVGGLVIGSALLERRQGWQFLVEQRFTSGTSWIPGTLPRIVVAASFAGLVLAAAWAQEEKVGPSRSWEKQSFLERTLQVREEWIVGSEGRAGLPGNAGLFLTLWLLTGFSVARLAALCFERRWLAIGVCLPASLVLAGIWVPSLVHQGLAWWQALAPCGILLLGCLLLEGGSRTLTGKGKVLVAGACLSMALVWIGGVLWHRATEIIDVGEPFVETDAPQQSGAEQQFVRAAREYRLVTIAVTRRLGRPETIPLGVFEDRAKQLQDSDSFWDWLALYQLQLDEVTHTRWPNRAAKLERWMEEVCEGDWVRLLEALGGMDRAPRAGGPEGGLDGFDSYTYEIDGQTCTGIYPQDAREMTQLLQARALLLQARGRLRPALDDYALMLKLSRHLSRRGTWLDWVLGLAIGEVACVGLEGWARVVREEGLLLRPLRELQGQEEALSLLDPVRDQYRLHVQLPPSASAALYGEKPEDARWKRELYHLACLAPWERERERRFRNRVYRDMAEVIQRPTWEEAPPQDRKGPRHPLDTAVESVEKLRMAQCRSFCRLGALRLQLALAAYRARNGRPAERIEDLGADLLEKVPLDPYSGKPFGYRVSKGERIRIAEVLQHWRGQLAVMDAFRWAPLPGAPAAPWMVVLPVIWTTAAGPLMGSLLDQPGVAVGDHFMQAFFEPHRWVAPGRGVLWSVGEDRRDDGGRDEQVDNIFLVPHPAP